MGLLQGRIVLTPLGGESLTAPALFFRDPEHSCVAAASFERLASRERRNL
jgi:hypothetical protein